MNTKALHKISYGLYIVTSGKEGRYNGQIANTAFQISSEPATIAISINKQNLTNEFIRDSKLFTVSVLDQETPLSLVGQFGFKSGREVDKFAGVNYQIGRSGVPYITGHTLAYLEAKVLQEIDAKTHTIFIGEVTGAEVMKEGLPMTYAYYQQVKRGSVPVTAPAYAPKQEKKAVIEDKYVCSICGYVYDPAVGDPENGIPPGTTFDKLPDEWTCPVCGVGKNMFEKDR
ncbi:MAG: High molecular weight rubredoxin [Pelotomaculum sp. PtaU1.Bin035]|nr:MAG: High molecular weight rubredoxin [Pelotomaculum sp. PtaU1.Bin035]